MKPPALQVVQVKHLRQLLKRKDASLAKKDLKIAEIHSRYSKLAIVKELCDVKGKLTKLQKMHKRLKHRNKTQRTIRAQGLNDRQDATIADLQGKLREKNDAICQLQCDNMWLQDAVNDRQRDSKFKKEEKQYPTEMRMLVYEAIVNNLPTKNIPTLISQFAKRTGVDIGDVPHRSTVEMMCRELGTISDFQVAEHMLENEDMTLGFDATTQEGVHVNSIHVTSSDKCHIIAVDPLAGGTAEDYEVHINQSVDNLVEVHCAFHKADKIKDNTVDFPKIRSEIIASVSNSMTDRAAVNHATIERLENSWGKKINELNCHLHPLETIATECRKALKQREPSNILKKMLGSDCMSNDLVLGLNKFRYKDAAGDPKGFVLALSNAKLPRGLLPRYRGNRLHVMFLICERLHEHREFFVKFLDGQTFSCNRLRGALQHDFQSPVAMVEIQVLGLLGKVLTGPWMARFYKGAASEISHFEGLVMVKEALDRLEVFSQDPQQILSVTHDIFGAELSRSPDLEALLVEPVDRDLFLSMMEGCINAVHNVLTRQYQRYFNMDVNDQLKKETESARLHNIDAEQVMGMFSALKDKAPNATLCFISCKIRAQKNKVLDYLDGLTSEKREKLIKVAITNAKKQRQRRRKNCAEIQEKVMKRLAAKQQQRLESERKKLEAKLKKPNFDLSIEFPEMDEDCRFNVDEIVGGKVVGRRICHIWFDKDTKSETMYYGQIDKYLKKQGGTYVIGYWLEGQNYEDDATDYEISKYQLASDLILKDLTLS